MPLPRLAPTPDPVLVQDTSLAIDGLPPERLQHLGGGHRASWHWGLGTTYHGAGTLWMGASAADSVTTGLGASTTCRTSMPATSRCSRPSAP